MVTAHFLDSSVAARILLGRSPEAAAWFDGVVAAVGDSVIASRLLRTELTRILRRESLRIAIRDQILRYVWTIPLAEATFTQAEAIVPHIKTVDAIHLASLLHTGIDTVVVTHDATMTSVAEALGYATLDPVTE